MGRGVFWLTVGRKGAGRSRREGAGDVAPSALELAMMRRAIALAKKAAKKGEVPVGAVVYDLATGAVLGEGMNTRECGRDPAGHAEFLAITRAAAGLKDWRLNSCGLAVTLEPCPMCAGLIVNARVARVAYGAPDPKAGAVRSLYRLLEDPRLNHRARVVPGVLAEECALLLREFFGRLRTARAGRAPRA